MLCFNPFTAQACKIFGAERCSDSPAKQCVFSRIEMLCLLMKILSHASAKKKTKRLKGFKFRTVIGRFQVKGLMAVNGLMELLVVFFSKH